MNVRKIAVLSLLEITILITVLLASFMTENDYVHCTVIHLSNVIGS